MGKQAEKSDLSKPHKPVAGSQDGADIHRKVISVSLRWEHEGMKHNLNSQGACLQPHWWDKPITFQDKVVQHGKSQINELTFMGANYVSGSTKSFTCNN